MQVTRISRQAVDFSRLTSQIGLGKDTVAQINAFRKRADEAKRSLTNLQEHKVDVDFSHYRSTLKNSAVVDELESKVKSFKPATYDVQAIQKAIDAFEAKAVDSAQQTEKKIAEELKDLQATLDNIQSARPFDQLTIDDVAAARPEITKTVDTMVQKGKWSVPGYKEKFGDLNISEHHELRSEDTDQPVDEGYRPLNVRDALSYLDQVKLRFQDSPEVYNHFLDTMKDFKSQSIDTPGVIDRVSSLFRGHPALIQGFNTFLPPGYRIECSDLSGTSPTGGTITVTTPMGVTTLQASASFLPAWQAQHAQPPPPDPVIPPSPSSHYAQNQQSGANTPTAASTLANQKPPVEFNHAISYVNKIKNRFNQDPETYKMFLEVLQTYQKEQRTIHEVYAQVNHLFHGAPDLLDEFKQFLPDTTGAAPQSGGLFQMVGQMVPQSVPSSIDLSQSASRSMTKKPTPKVDDKKKKRAPTSDSSQKQYSKTKKPKFVHRETSPQSQISHPMSTQQPTYSSARMEEPPQFLYESPSMRSATIVPPSIPIDKTLATVEEMAFFDRVKKFIDDKTTYHEFLKLLNLFTQDIIDARTLVDRSQLFIGENKELWDFFKAMVGIVPGPGSGGPGGTYQIENIPAIERPRIELEECKKYGASYRKLPQSEISLSCSGRDAMCWEVLNDEWVSHPTWASEDSGFVAHRKNHFEEALHKSEEERHEYDYHIEANLRTITLLEPIAARISAMDGEERAAFRLKPGLGGQSKSIYQRIIKKVYGQENGLEIINALHENPSVAVPVVLNRLKAKDEEWKRAQREWNKVWRELDARNYYKSLDHQGIVWKQNEKKNLTSKQLILEIETLRKEQIQRRKSTMFPAISASPMRSRYQMGFILEDQGVLFDAIKLILAFIDRPVPPSTTNGNSISASYYNSNNQVYSASEREKFETVLRDLVQAFFKIDEDKFNHYLSPNAGATDGVDGDRDETMQTNGDREASPSTRDAGKPWTNITTEQASVVHTEVNNDPTTKRKHLNFFCNSTYYIAFRLLYILYSRLHSFKMLAQELTTSKKQPVNPLAKEMGLHDTSITQTVGIPLLENTTKDGAETPASVHYYDYLLELSERLFEGEIDQNVFEESLRWMFGTRAYPIFTVDKLISQLLKQLGSIASDQKCQELLYVLQAERREPSSSNSRQFIYRNKAQRIIGSDEPLYRIEWVGSTKELRMQLLAREDLTVDVDERKQTRDQKWTYYIQSYLLQTPTEGLNADLTAPFLYRSIPQQSEEAEEDDEETAIVDRSEYSNGMELRICMRTYRMFFVPKTEDSFVIKKFGKGVQHSLGPGLRFGGAPGRVNHNARVSNENRLKRLNNWLGKIGHGPDEQQQTQQIQQSQPAIEGAPEEPQQQQAQQSQQPNNDVKMNE
ncbi:hypothetical protein E3P89_00322 [Wallemia ichthyophaga]|uniref:ATP synthase subunit d, mitochondrial n=1 Tax=Wallemia ichthyophaga TaxID=245174 RepID=A0A4T0ELD6_WALIC|nr:hypothetical protein E3P91_00467 [Wallemia ichthyophaga]TIB00704.1 hypothetical protein E3P95_01596 [Wallemia ichthyophaga]TIB01052.1 hypothetical protein E3P94_01982 [Wallemia ichthyophaga]TIB16296.1 hypothetical protein E3P90_00481 [Wallemia ichthyophaga]TIB17994.1 hypothetical protein E3P93_00338 [Wallemia ichthyophaga]